MKVLQLCYKPPYPALDGGMMGMHNVTRGLLAAGEEVWVLTVESDKHPLHRANLSKEYVRTTHLQAVKIDLVPHAFPAAVALLTGESYNVKRYENAAFQQCLVKTLQETDFDTVLFESVFLSPYVATVRKHSHARVVLHAPNVEHRIWRDAALQCKSPLKRWYMKHLALSLRAYECEMARRYDAVVCVSKRDAAFFQEQGQKHILVKPYGVCLDEAPKPAFPNQEEGEELSLYHLGSMDWQANVQSVEWFLGDVWPRIRATVPQARLYLAGRKMSDEMKSRKIEGVTMVGEVDDAAAFVADKQINVVPLLYGSGIRVKIIEAMTAGKTVISTAIGAEGIEYTDGKNILIANTAEDFVRLIARCADDGAYCRRIAQGGRMLVEERYDNAKLTRQLINFILPAAQ
ncbi:MAG: glycosyltransferase family 4 protein [Bacteroidales bacterium]|nr:glycosyltransferase family 4 protein [Bacteroidales bacterium]